MSVRDALTVVGTAVGAYFGAPQLGYAIGSLVGSAVDPQIIPGPKVGEVTTQTAHEGGPRPIVFGASQPLSPNVIAQGPPRIVKSTQSQGKGGPEVETESLLRTYAVGICEGPVQGIARVWRNNTLVYDATDQPLLSEKQNQAFLRKARFFYGDYDQLPSPDLEAVFGVGTTPAHRGTAYMVMVNEDLTDMRGAIPQWVFLVQESALRTRIVYDEPGVYEWEKPARLSSVTVRCIGGGGGGSSGSPQVGNGFGQSGRGGGGGGLSVETVSAASLSSTEIVTVGAGGAGGAAHTNTDALANDGLGPYNSGSPGGDSSFGAHVVAGGGQADGAEIGGYSAGGSGTTQIGGKGGPDRSNNGGDNIVIPPGESLGSAPGGGSGGMVLRRFDSYSGITGGGGGSTGSGALIQRGGKQGASDINALGAAAQSGSAGRGPHAVNWSGSGGGGGGAAGANVTPKSFAIAGAGGRGGRFGGGGGGSGAAQSGSDHPSTCLSGGDGGGGVVVIDMAYEPGAKAMSLAETVTAICARAGLTADMIDVTELLDIYHDGFTVTNAYMAIDALRALGQTFLFDVTTVDGKAAFVLRGKNSVTTIPADDFVDEGENADDGTLRDDAIVVPRVLNMIYFDIAGGLAPSKQTSERAGDRRSQGDRTVQIPVIMDSNQAARLCAITHKVMVEDQRGIVRLVLPDSYIRLVPTDVVIAPVAGVNSRLRIQGVEINSGYQVYECVHDRQSAYVSVVEGIPAVPPTPPPSSLVGDTMLAVLDVALLNDLDDTRGLGYYVAVGAVSDAWRGAEVALSRDDGANYGDPQFTTVSAVMGVLATQLDDHPAEWPDELSEFDVEIAYSYHELQSADYEGLLNRENMAAIGDEIEGYELISFQNADEVSPGIWRLSGLLRGRKGTQSRRHLFGEKFVLLNRQTLAFIETDALDLGATLTFRARSVGAVGDAATTVSIEFAGRSQVERAPAFLSAYAEDGELVVNWLGVGRLGGGGQPAHGVEFEGYHVAAGAETLDTTEQEARFSLVSLPETFDIVVSQVNRLTGEGPTAQITFDGGLPNPAGGDIYARVVFSGSVIGTEDVVVRGLYKPAGGASIPLYLAISGSGKIDPDDYADELFAYLDGLSLPAPAVVSMPTSSSVQIQAEQGDTLSLVATPLHPQTRTAYKSGSSYVGGTYRLPAPTQNGTRQIVYIGLYRNVGAFVNPAPESSEQYRIGGLANISFSVFGVDWDAITSIPGEYAGQLVTLFWSVPNNVSSNRAIGLNDLVAADGLPKPDYSLLAQYADTVNFMTVGGYIVVAITMKHNYRIAPDVLAPGWIMRGSHPSGFLPATQQDIAPVARYPDGAKMMTDFRFFPPAAPEFFDSGLGGWEAGMTIELTLDGDTVSYTLDTTEAAALNTLDNSAGSPLVTTLNAIYDDLESQIALLGKFDVLHEVYANGQYKDWRVERNVVNTLFTIAHRVTGYDLTVANETTAP